MLLETPTVKLGWKATDFTLSDPDGQTHSFDSLMGENGLLVAFICNHCPYVVAVAERFSEDANTLQKSGINVVAINSNDYNYVPADSPEKMKLFQQQYDFRFPYLVDEDQSVARSYDAVCTPDFFGFDKNGTLGYRGRLDDARMDDPSNRTPELVIAMQQIANDGSAPEPQHASMGCSIKWRKS